VGVRRHGGGGALSNGGNLLRWVRDLVGAPLDGPAMAAAAAMPPDAHGLTLLPFVAGERSPGWHDGADAAIAGVTLATRPEHLLRAAMEAVALRFARVYEALRPLAAPEHEIVVNGGAIVNSPAWLGIVADALGHDLLALPAGDEASARGAALVALVAAGVLPDLAAADPAAAAEPERPDPDRHARYKLARARQERLEAALYPASGEPLLS
jgi:gluconokinase